MAITVTGRIVPTSCELILNNRPDVNFKVKRRKNIPMSIHCGAVARIALRMIDNQHGEDVDISSMHAAKMLDGAYRSKIFISGRDEQKKDAYLLYLNQVSADGKRINLVQKNAHHHSQKMQGSINANSLILWRKHASLLSVAASDFHADIAVRPLLDVGNKRTQKPVVLDGSITVELQYQ